MVGREQDLLPNPWAGVSTGEHHSPGLLQLGEVRTRAPEVLAQALALHTAVPSRDTCAGAIRGVWPSVPHAAQEEPLEAGGL